MVVPDATAVSDAINLTNQLIGPTAIAVLGAVTGIISIINHLFHTKTTEKLKTEVTANSTKIETFLAKETPNIDTGINIASELSPQIKDAIVANHPTVIALQNKVTEMDAQIKNFQNYINSVASAQGNTAAAQIQGEVVKNERPRN